MTKNKKSICGYLIMIIVFGLLILLALRFGVSTYQKGALEIQNTATSSFSIFCRAVADNLKSSVMMLLIQIIVILFVCRIFSTFFRHLGQPGVIGEIVAGIILGPSFLGHFFPGAFHFIFSHDSLENVHMISQIGLVLFMFVIGLEVDFKVLKNKINETLFISHAGIFVPFFLGIIASFYIYREYATQTTSFLSFALFIGISMSITAFPVLARIVQERGLTRTPLGVLAIASAANDDVTAWCLLAVVIAVAKAGTFASALFAVAFTILYIIFMFFIVRPFFYKMGKIYGTGEVINKSFVSLIFLTLIISSALTELLGIHALFGAFIAGVIMPPDLNFRHIMMNKIEDVTLAFFLPLFFAYTGLNTNVLLINNLSMWMVCGLFILMACIGKFGGCALAAKIVGETWHNSLIIGVLMNTRGLMELVALNIGYEMGILSQPIFAALVIMALVTTFMTTPTLHFISYFHKKKLKVPCVVARQKLMLCFAQAEAAPHLLSIFQLLFGKEISKKQLIAAHFTQGTDLNIISAEHYANSSFRFLENKAEKNNLQIEQRYKLTDNIVDEIVDTVQKEDIDYLLIGSAFDRIQHEAQKKDSLKMGKVHSFFHKIHQNTNIIPTIILTEKTHKILQRTTCNVIVFVSKRELKKVPQIFIVINRSSDRKLLEFVSGLLQSVEAIHIYLSTNITDEECNRIITKLLVDNPDKIGLHKYSSLSELFFNHVSGNLILSSYDVCLEMLKTNRSSNKQPSYLCVRFKEGEEEKSCSQLI